MGGKCEDKTLAALIENSPADEIIGNNLILAWAKINSPLYEKILCSISGGADSDIVLDICTKCDKSNKISYAWYDTGLEYEATKKHLTDLEKKYHVHIEKYKAKKPIPAVCKKYGQPFLSKRVSDYIQRLQKHGFNWEDESFEYGLKRTGCAGCPFCRDLEAELKVIKNYEPKLYAAVNQIFSDSYNYTRRYRKFCAAQKAISYGEKIRTLF